MVNSFVAQIMIDVSLVLLILGAILEAVVDIREMNPPQFLPPMLGNLPSSDPATALGIPGIGLFVLGLGLETLTWALPGGRFVVGLVAIVAFLMGGGYVFGD